VPGGKVTNAPYL